MVLSSVHRTQTHTVHPGPQPELPGDLHRWPSLPRVPAAGSADTCPRTSQGCPRMGQHSCCGGGTRQLSGKSQAFPRSMVTSPDHDWGSTLGPAISPRPGSLWPPRMPCPAHLQPPQPGTSRLYPGLPAHPPTTLRTGPMGHMPPKGSHMGTHKGLTWGHTRGHTGPMGRTPQGSALQGLPCPQTHKYSGGPHLTHSGPGLRTLGFPFCHPEIHHLGLGSPAATGFCWGCYPHLGLSQTLGQLRTVCAFIHHDPGTR